MIAYVKGTVADIAEDNAVIEINGIGYNVRISADTAARMPGVGETAKLYTYTSVREDAIQLFGFLSGNDLAIFKKCITVNGIGPKGALAILSVLDADSLRFAIMSGDVKTICKAPGIGARTAERLILELKDKIKADDAMIEREIESTRAASAGVGDNPQKKEAVEALVSLGYGHGEAVKAVNAIEGIESMDSGGVLKAALKKMF
ncbi:Holliday junction branch migration protein RuvA [Acetatifactor muris]|jgi:Holliday junction DNA helicase RuvA|uniref:Holliday junction branch migration complex subunit RuvA n=1 Tax=Acetatifactor muris TaxID=879566 RepID=A0A2K4ZDT2_9FIRM|nr:Holliday junction branch migration protein RuvA [Acetatifactor muris]MCR2046796.1 Holliday junction branch migration protein RuvA [Acetatifactor muris]SOY28618.1 Holliday junction ATP-dependent DNA helicase RuvA [Acetatifactor muris]